MGDKVKLVTVLGAGDYDPCEYYEGHLTRHVQEAIIKKHSEEIEKVIILATEYAKEQNWGSSEAGENKSLQEVLNDLQEEIDFSYEVKDIDTVESEAEVWELFDNVVEAIDEGEKIYFDITHGFRYQPLIVMGVLNYVKVLKNAQIKKILYGLFAGKHDSKVIDMTSLDYLNDWVTAVDSFLTTGSAKKIAEVSSEEINKVMAATRGQDEFFKNLRDLVNSLESFEERLKTCRGKKINKSIISVLDHLDKLNNDNLSSDNKRIAPFEELSDKITEKFDYFASDSKNELENYFNLLEWCEEHNLVQQGLTILTENIITLIADESGYDYYDFDIRDDIKAALLYLDPQENDSKEEWDYENEEVFETGLKIIEDKYPKLPKLFAEISKNLRNDVNHFGMREDDSGVNRLKNKLTDNIEAVKQALDFEEKDEGEAAEETNLFLLFSHQLTDEQKEDAKESLGVDNFVYLPEDLQQKWSNIPAEQQQLKGLMKPFKEWLLENASKNDYVLIQGDFGATFIMVQWSFTNDLIPVYSTTVRNTVEEHEGNEIKMKKRFKHVLYREYEKSNY